MNGLGELELSTGLLTWDDAAYALHGVDRAEQPDVAAALKRQVHPDDLAGLSASLGGAGAGRDSVTLAYRVLAPGGPWLVRARGRVAEGAGPRLVLVYWREAGGLDADAAAELARSRHIFERSMDGIFLTDAEGRCLDVNPAGVAMVGYTPDELRRLSIHDLVDAGALAAAGSQREVVKRGGQMNVMRPLRRRDGGLVHVEVSVSALPGGDKLAIARDVTERVRRDAVMGARLRLSEMRIEGGLDALLREVSHELQVITDSALAGFCSAAAAPPGPIAECARRREVLLHDGPLRSAETAGARPAFEPATRALLIPIARQSEVVGVLCVGDKPSAYTPEDVEIAQQLVASLMEIVWRREAELALAEANRTLNERLMAGTAELSRGERNLQSLLATASDGIHVLDEEGNIILCSHSFARMLGYTLEEASRLNVRDWDAFFPEDEIGDAVKALFVTPGTFETRHRRKDGTIFDVEIHAIATELDGQRYLYASSRDITERKRAAEQYRVMVDNTNTAFTVCDPQGVVWEANENFIRLIGREAHQVIGRSVLEWTAPECLEANAQALARCLEEGRVTDLQMSYMHLDGRRVPISINAALMQTERGPVFVAYCRDLTTEQRLVAALTESNRELEEFAYVASHDLQEPLRMVASYTELLAVRYRGQLDEKADRYIHHASEGARRMQGLITDILAYSRLSTRSEMPAPISLDEVLDDALQNLGMAIHEAEAVITRDPLPVVVADRRQLVQLFQNLVGNALKFRSAAAVRVHVGAVVEGRSWVFSVRDNGIGMDMQYADRVFRVFQRLHVRSKYPGNGIGLAIVKKIVERHEGQVWVDSAPDQGTTIFFTLPARPPR